jgi:hypothetical protein
MESNPHVAAESHGNVRQREATKLTMSNLHTLDKRQPETSAGALRDKLPGESGRTDKGAVPQAEDVVGIPSAACTRRMGRDKVVT